MDATLLVKPLEFEGRSEADEMERVEFGRGEVDDVGEAKRDGLLGLVIVWELDESLEIGREGGGVTGADGGGSGAGSKL